VQKVEKIELVHPVSALRGREVHKANIKEIKVLDTNWISIVTVDDVAVVLPITNVKAIVGGMIIEGLNKVPVEPNVRHSDKAVPVQLQDKKEPKEVEVKKEPVEKVEVEKKVPSKRKTKTNVNKTKLSTKKKS